MIKTYKNGMEVASVSYLLVFTASKSLWNLHVCPSLPLESRHFRHRMKAAPVKRQETSWERERERERNLYSAPQHKEREIFARDNTKCAEVRLGSRLSAAALEGIATERVLLSPLLLDLDSLHLFWVFLVLFFLGGWGRERTAPVFFFFFFFFFCSSSSVF